MRKPPLDAAGAIRLASENYKFKVQLDEVVELPSYDDRAFALRGHFVGRGDARAILKVFNDEDSAADGFLEVRWIYERTETVGKGEKRKRKSARGQGQGLRQKGACDLWRRPKILHSYLEVLLSHRFASIPRTRRNRRSWPTSSSTACPPTRSSQASWG